MNRWLHGLAGDRQALAIVLVYVVLKLFVEPLLILGLIALRVLS